MNIKKFICKATIVAVSIGLAAVSAHAGPPRDSGRNVIGEAQILCAFPLVVPLASDVGEGSDKEIFALACAVLWKTNGEQIGDHKACEAGGDTNDFVTYTGRNCVKNEAALERKAASVVLSMDDVIARNKSQKALTAADYACEYASKATFLDAVHKLVGGNELIGNAESIANALGYPCEN